MLVINAYGKRSTASLEELIIIATNTLELRSEEYDRQVTSAI